MKFRWDKKYLYWGVTLFVVIAASVVFFLITSQLPAMKRFCQTIIGVLKPVLYGIVFAYLMTPLLRRLEFPIFMEWGRKLFHGNEKRAKTFTRILGIFLTLVIVLVVVIGLLWMVIPRVFESLQSLAFNLPTYFSRGRDFLVNYLPEDSELQSTALNMYDSLYSQIAQWISGDFMDDIWTVVINVTSGVYSVISEIVNIIVGIVVAVYILVAKEKFLAQSKKLLYSIVDTKTSQKLLSGLHHANQIFGGFIGGKIVDSLIIGVLCYFILWIFDMPYKELVSVIIGVTNIIPFFGPFIGAIPSAFLILLVSPMKCLTFLIIILALQQFDGNILGPKILGEATGLGSFWVITAILVGGGLFGFPGMVFGVPVFAVFYYGVKGFVENSLKKKGLPTETEEFKKIAYIDPTTGNPVYREDLKEPGQDPEEKS